MKDGCLARKRQVLEEKKPDYVIRVDIKSYYKSIPHFKLIQDIKKYYDDPKLLTMLKEIIINPIDTPYGYKNPVHGIMEVLHERRLTLSRKKSRLGLIKDSFHYLGVSYSPTQLVSHTNVYANDARYLSNMGGGRINI